MNKHTLRVLEFDKIISIVASYAASEPGKARVSLLHPASERSAVTKLLAETLQLVRLLQAGETPPLEGIYDIDPILCRIRAGGGMVSPAELLMTASTLAAGRRVKTFFHKIEDQDGHDSPLPAIAGRIRPLKQVEDAIGRAIDEKAEVRDSASPGLRKVRKQIVRMREDILGRMNLILQDSGLQKVIQEPVVTLRDDRYVLPLKPNFRQSLQGVVHGQSGSRATLFVEPLDVLEQNNRLAELRMEEHEEVERILRELTSLLSKDADAVEATVAALSEIDAAYARARFGIEYGAVVPQVPADMRLHLRGAKHPLLVGKTKGSESAAVVPNDITLEPEQRALILSGPNAGGKTAILKTTGLLCLMAQSGLPVTALEGSEIPCFGSVFADIGDEQSLEQDLSTFSSHVRRIAEILQSAGRDSLVLLDELGSGTEPGEGAGLGAAVLETLIGRGCITVITTHHNALKLFGSETTGAVNAAMEFDPQSLQPTYRLIQGRPGRSYGLDMAARTGIPDDIIAKARSRISEDDVSLDRLLRQVEEDSRLLESERQALARELESLRRDRADAEAALRDARDDAREIRTKAGAEAKEVLSALRQKLRELSRAAAFAPPEIKRAAAEVEAIGRKLQSPPPARFSGAAVQDFHAGDRVRVEKLNKTGVVLASGRDFVELDIAGKKIKLPASDVVPVEAGGGSGPAAGTGWSAELKEEEDAAADRINIIGLRVAEGIAEVERMVDRAVLHHLSVMTIIHGLGTGALKTAVSVFLKGHPLIATFRSGEPAEGGAGVTIAELKR